MSYLDTLNPDGQQHFLSWYGDIARSLMIASLSGKEALSTPYSYQVLSLTNQDETQVAKWHGQAVALRIGDGSQNQPSRIVHGIVTRIRYKHLAENDAECLMTVEPSISLLAMGRMMRVWQNISVPDLVSDLLREYGIQQLDLQLRGSYPKREYCIQYRESALIFIQRLLEEEGIYYYFLHSENAHTLVLADHPASHPSIAGKTLAWHHQGDTLSQPYIDNWSSTSALIPAGIALQGVNLQQATAIDEQQDTVRSANPAEGVTWTDITPHGDRTLIASQAKGALAAWEANGRMVAATVNSHWLCSGETFSFTGHPSGEATYRIQQLDYDAINNLNGHQSSSNCKLQLMANDTPWLPPRTLLPPQMAGILTATVVGPSSEEIHTDEYGRIKIQFPWDQQNPNDDTSSCWVRVAQSWTGGKFGAQFIPRVGSEVLVSFVQGHPDFPLVTGTVYNGQNKPPFSLPAEKNESGFATRSSTQGSADDGHRLSFNDKKGEEKLTIVAQKDLSLTVKNDVTSTIAANRSTELTKGNDQLHLKKGDLTLTLDKGDWQQSITGNATTQLKNGNYSLKVTGGSGAIKTDKALTLESTQSIELKVGSNKISISTSGITISGTMVSIKGSGTTEVKGAMTTISGSGMTKITGGIINIG